MNYYLMAQNVGWLALLQWNAETSMLKTLAAKHHSSVAKMAVRYKAKIETSDGKRTCFEARKERAGRKPMISRFGGIPLRPDRQAVIADPEPPPVHLPPRELIYRLRKRWCELCENHATVEVHQVRRLADLGTAGSLQPGWAALMAQMRRKTLVVCSNCHALIHATPVTHAE